MPVVAPGALLRVAEQIDASDIVVVVTDLAATQPRVEPFRASLKE
jgi:hypothetical protein